MSHTGWVILTAALMLPGLVGVLLPIVPGIPLMFAIAAAFGFANRFQQLTVIELLMLLALMLVSIGLDFVSGVFGARYGGASKWSVAAGFGGFLLGLILLPPFGGIIGMFVAVVLVEVSQHRDQRKALRAATGSVIGNLAGMAISLILAVLFIVCFVFFAWR